MAELRAGGLAVVIGGEMNKALIGRTVGLVRIINQESAVKIPGQPIFWNEGPARWLIKKDGLRMSLSNHQLVTGFALILPAYLMPIDGEDFSHEKESEKQLQNA